jgi:hypothetical protein
MFREKFVEKIKTHILCSITCNAVEPGRPHTDDNMAHAHCLLDT